MDMFNKLKAKLAEELDSETESNAEYAGYDRGAAGAAQGSPADQARALEAEVRDLKEHINKNYFIYVKRLEKRKERIKELEEYAKLVVRDNESLNEKLKEFEECQTQLGRARDNLDELEGFQSQELAKVKHMLLSAETALEKETRERKELGERVAKGESEAEKLRLEVSRKDAKLAEKENDLEARVAEVRREQEAKVQRLEERLNNQDLSGDERLDAVLSERDNLEVELRGAEAECATLQTKLTEAKEHAEAAQIEAEQSREELSKLKQEKDALRSTLLELEIANHEHQNSKNADIDGLKMEVAKLNTEKETLEMTLDLRDRELKAKKEEFRNDLSFLENRKSELEQEADSKSSRMAALEAELTVLKEKLAETSRDFSSVNSEVAVHKEKVSRMEEASRNKDESLISLGSELEQERKSATDSAKALSELEVRYSEVVADYEKVVIDLGDVSQAKEELEESCTEKTRGVEKLGEKVRSLEGIIKEKEDSFGERVEATELVLDLRRQLLQTEDDLADKRKIIKLHGQRIVDIKKTMQKELRAMTTTATSSSAPFAENGHTSCDSSRVSCTPTPPPLAGHSPTASFDAGQLVLSSPFGQPSGGTMEIVAMTEVNFKYLKHVIFKFFTSREYEAQHLTRAISALLKFTSDEERLLQEHLEWKMSWFGAKPKLGSGQFSLSIPDPS